MKINTGDFISGISLLLKRDLFRKNNSLYLDGGWCDTNHGNSDFSDLQNNIEPEWVELTKPFRYSKDYFVCQVVGESMNKVIPNNAWCLFKKDPVGSRMGKIVLAHAGNIQDADFGKGYTVKLYESEKVITDEKWSHSSIILKPQLYNTGFQNLILNEDDMNDFKIVGTFVEVLK